jgi:hypothetical protein
MLRSNDYVDEALCGSDIFYQHGMCRYYLTPRQFEQLKWREEIVRRRRVADALDKDDDSNISNNDYCDRNDDYERTSSRRSRKQRRKSSRITNDNSFQRDETVTWKSTTNIVKPSKTILTTELVTKPLIWKQRSYRVKDEEDERKNINQSIAPIFYQICKGTNGRMKRLPMLIRERPCHNYIASHKILPFVSEDEYSSISFSPSKTIAGVSDSRDIA